MTRRYTRSRATIVEPLADCLDHGDEEVMQALATAGALVARADGRIDAVERDELVNFVDRQRLVPTISAPEIAAAFDSCARRLETGDDTCVVAEALRPLAGLSLASIVVRTAERVAAADLQIHSGELEALKLIREVMRTASARQPARSSHPVLAQMIFFIIVVTSASMAMAAAMLLPVINELAHRIASPKATVVSSSDDDNYLELFASGPGRDWYVLGKARGAPSMKAMGSDRVSGAEIGAHGKRPEVAPVDRVLDPHITSSEN